MTKTNKEQIMQRLKEDYEKIKEEEEKRKEHNKQRYKEYSEKNRDHIHQKASEYYTDNIEYNRQRTMEYKQLHKEQINQIITCEICGSQIRRDGIKRHQSTIKCKKSLPPDGDEKDEK